MKFKEDRPRSYKNEGRPGWRQGKWSARLWWREAKWWQIAYAFVILGLIVSISACTSGFVLMAMLPPEH